MNQLDPAAPRQAVSLSLSTDVVAAARDLTGDLSGTVEMLLAKYVQDARRGMDDAGLAEVVVALNRFHAEHGFLSDEFSNL
jgi:antitoxin CcdA